MSAPYESVVFIPAEAQFVQNTMFQFSQNQAVANNTDAGGATPITQAERLKALDIVGKVRKQITDPTHAPIAFTEAEAQLMQRLYVQYIQVHGKPQGDLDWTYWVHFDDSSRQLVINVIRKVGGLMPNLPASSYPQGYNPFVRL
jgi:hypothetical protein